MTASVAVLASCILARGGASVATGGGMIPPELTTPNYRFTKLGGIGHQKGVARQDPSNVIRVGELYHVWYTQRKTGTHPYASTVYHATSTDGFDWQDRGEAFGKGPKGAWDSFGVITPYVAVIDGTYYLFYTGTSAERPFKSRGADGTLRHLGVAVADDAGGPWRRFEGNPVLSPDEGAWDSLIVDDTHVIVREGKCWLYYKGGHRTIKPSDTEWGLALADSPTGPYVKHGANPLIGGHTVCVWPHWSGIAAFVDKAGPERFTVQYSPDGIRFERAARLEVVHTGCGPYDPDAFTDARLGGGITWGVAQNPGPRGELHIVRFDVDLLALPEPPAGHEWQRVAELSDDFGGAQVDGTKWLTHHPYWKGREPSRFDPANVSVRDGKLRLRSTTDVDDLSGVKDPKKDVWVRSACLSSKRRSASYGYYETRMRASRLSMTSSFWFQGKYSEIDVVEEVGRPAKKPGRGRLMLMNTHFYKGGWKHDKKTPKH
ncbi:MAG: family 43 glycosylhydrolase, partial [Planctomycetota bacterium]